ncbi:MAG: lipopolysaccharide biosynthesis protein [Acidimicrobiales bacterium]
MRVPRGAIAAQWGLMTELSGLTMSLLTFVVVGSRLGPGRFGLLAAVLATIGLLGPLLTASPEHVIVQRIAQGTPCRDAWMRSVAVLVTVGPLSSLAIVAVAVVVAPGMSPAAVILISIGEIASLGLSRVAVRAHEAEGDSRSGARVAALTLLFRAAALVAFLTLASPTLTSWSVLHFLSSGVAGYVAHRSLFRGTSIRPNISLPTTDDYRLGLPFSLNAGPDGLLSDNDKMVLSGSGLEVDAGIYAAAYRIASIAGVPARSVLRIRYASYFRKENQSAESSVRNAWSIVRATAPAGLASGLAIFFLAPVAEWVLGDDFSDSVPALRLLAFLPFIRSILTPGANVLTGTGRQRLRIFGTLGAGLLNLGLNLLLIPSYGWRAAVFTTLLAELALLVWVWFHVLRPGKNFASPQR